MKIAHVNVYFYPQMVGGAEWYVYNISRYLAKRGHEVHVFTVNSYQGKAIGPSEDEVDGVTVHRLPLWLNLTYRAKIWKGLKNSLLKHDFDIIHTYDYGQPHSRTATKAAKERGKPVALTVFDVHSMIPRPFYKRIFMKLYDDHFSRQVLRNSNRILVRAPNLVEPLVQFGAEREKIRVTPSGIVDEALKPADGQSFINRFSVQGNPVILYLGRLHPMKGPQYIIRAAPQILKEYPQSRFVFVGAAQGNYQETLFEMADKLGILERLFFTGPIYDFETKMRAYAAADVFVMPSGYEGTSQAIFEAMSQEKPIVATNRGGIPFQVEHEKEALLFEYADEEALASSILRLLENPQLAKTLGRNAKEKVRKFTYSILTSQIEEIYEEMRAK